MTMIDGIDTAALSCLIETLYEATQSVDAWTGVMALLCQYLHADSALIRFYAPDWSTVNFSATHGFDPHFDAGYREHFVDVDPIPLAIQRLPPGSPALLEEIIPFEQLKCTEFYNDYMLPQDKRHGIGGYVCTEGGVKAIFGVQRGQRRQPFRLSDKTLLNVLMPHFTQVLRLHQTLAQERACSAAANCSLGALSMSAFFLDKNARVCFVNSRGEYLVRAGRLVTVRHGCLHALRHDHEASLQKLILSVTQNRTMEIPRAGGVIQLARPAFASEAFTAVVAPWRRSAGFGDVVGAHIVAAVFIGTCTGFAMRSDFLADAYGLTRTEARLAVTLIKNCDLELSARAIGVKTQTARGYLKTIFRKTDCHNQADLVRLILSSPTGLWGRETETSEFHEIS